MIHSLTSALCLKGIPSQVFPLSVQNQMGSMSIWNPLTSENNVQAFFAYKKVLIMVDWTWCFGNIVVLFEFCWCIV